MSSKKQDRTIRVVHYQRKSFPSLNFSIESIFKDVRSLQPHNLSIDLKVSNYLSKGILPRIYNLFEAWARQQDVNHITGDVHYLNLFFRSRKCILTVHDCVSLKRLTGWKQRFLKYFWFTLPVKKASVVTVNSNATKADLLTYVTCDPGKIKVIYNAISTIYQPAPKEFNSSRPTILQIGAKHNKNLERLLQALEGIPCHLVILGKAKDHISDLLIKHKISASIIDPNLTDREVYELYKSCDLLSFVSTHEGFGMPIIEANATGRVVITSNTTSMPEVACDAALLVDPYSVECIRAGILNIISDNKLRGQLIENGYNNAKRFDRQAIAGQYFDLYRSIANQALA